MMVLLIEDDPATGRTLVELASRAGQTAFLVGTGGEALRVLFVAVGSSC